MSNLKFTSPLCFLPDGRLLCYQKGHVLLLKDGVQERSIRIPISAKERWLGPSRYLSRLFRLGIRTSIAVDNERILLSRGNVIQELNLTTGKLSQGWNCEEGIRPLIFTDVKGIDGFDDGIYFGGYLGNMPKRPVNIYRRTDIDQWKVVYTFPQGAINHVHNVVADNFRQCLWIFTGDFDEAAAIWKVSDGFKIIERVLCNNQKYRGCTAFALPEGLLYATDAPYAENDIYLLDPDSLTLKDSISLHGSCIYGCQWKENFVFSSTVEGDGRNLSKWDFLFSCKRGEGIKDNYVHMYIGNLKDGFRELYKEKKDCWPLYTFQFGVFKFPSGINNTDTLYFQPMATVYNDGKLMAIPSKVIKDII